ncbi:hypothetical protein DCS_01723 [Drechmeria coniospora]|uniref:Uncharacterized protein n=1 Tax=Drechmeria coniospora TaxID=98403 RepID=A0A151GTY6_DRECN|nr:hypothetical protein DCS_01723 [Drechmeria coniospora]KYK60586.1 hypothetical protein DCS_01723 [Drechmeria coniospora]
MDDTPARLDDTTERRSAGYKSWKKKYRKMRIRFDRKMEESDELHKQEDKASATMKRLAIENDRLLDVLLEINSSLQIPPEKRIDLSLEPSADPKVPTLPLDRHRHHHRKQQSEAMKRFEQLLLDVPHSSYAATKETCPSSLVDLAAPKGDLYPAPFLTADDIDNYMHAIDVAVEPDAHMPTLAPGAHPQANPTPHPHLKNPTSSRGTKADRGGKASVKGKKAAARLAADRERAADWDASMDEDPDMGSTPAVRGKRKRDDDGGYRPGGSTTRPTKKKRKSEGGDGTPTVRRSKKDKESLSGSKDN